VSTIPAECRLAVDIGGTFTDIVLETRGRRDTLKILTTPRSPEQAVLAGATEILAHAGLAPAHLSLFIHGTTLATNAIIERKGARTALLATAGFRDVLEIADEGRYNQFDIFLERHEPLVPRSLRLGVPERIDAKGNVVQALDETAVGNAVQKLRAAGVESVAICFMHSYANPRHEQRVRDILLAGWPGLPITLSSEVCPEIREYERTSTSVANAYVQPLMAGYLGRLRTELTARGFTCPFYLMTSGGGLTTLETARRFPIRLVESGPAGGAILASTIAAEMNEQRVVSFDMGGTTAKICLIEHTRPHTARSFEVDRRDRFMKGSGLPLRIPVIEMVEIGAGGGSIARLDAMRRVCVGPDSAGSEPGPACYGRGGTAPTVTDSDLVLGRIDPHTFAGGRLLLDRGSAERALAKRIGAELALSNELAAFAVVETVDETMTNAARVHAVERGKAIADHTLIAFGGAAPLHVARLAQKLGISRAIVPVNAGVGSAVGFLRAPISFEVVRSRPMVLAAFDPAAATALFDEMRAEALAVVGQAGSGLLESRAAFMRYVGQGHEIAVPLSGLELGPASTARIRQRFEAEYATLFARTIPHADVEILTWTLSLATRTALPEPIALPTTFTRARPGGQREIFDSESGRRETVPVYERAALAAGSKLSGPAVITEHETTTFVTAPFDATIAPGGAIVLTRRP